MNKNLLALLGIAPVLTPLHTLANDRPDTRPNIIFFLVDDMGWQDTSLPFWTEKTMYNERYETPNMERLARQGMMFTQAYASSISSPTRCSLMTGANAARHRVTNWTLRKNQNHRCQERRAATARLELQRHCAGGRHEPHLRGQVVRAVPERQRLPHHPLRKGTLGSHRHSGRESLPLRL